MYGDGFFSTTPTVQSMKEIIDKLDSLKIKNLCFAKDYQKNEKTSHRLGLSENQVTDKGHAPRICKELLKLNKKQTS